MSEKVPLQRIGEPVHRRHLQKCRACGRGVMHTGLPLCWRVTVERMGIDTRALAQEHGLELQIGAQLAAVMGPDPALMSTIPFPTQILICEECALKPAMLAALVVEDE